MSDDNAATLRTYEQAAQLYRERSARVAMDDGLIDLVTAHAPEGAHVLEIGSGPGVDAAVLEERGFQVRRTDATAAFVEMLRAQGHVADLLDVRTDDIGGPYDVVFAQAVLLHIDRGELPRVLTRLAAAVRPGGLLAITLKEGDGDEWSSHKVELPRHFVFWREEPLRAALSSAGWELVVVYHLETPHGPWLVSLSRRREA